MNVDMDLNSDASASTTTLTNDDHLKHFSDMNNDELIKEQEERIEKEIADNIPYVSDMVEVIRLLNEYDDDVYKLKVKDLTNTYKYIRKTRPDGNCFFRAFTFSYFDSLIGDKKEYDRFFPIAKESKDKLVELGFPAFTIEDFHDNFMDTLVKIGEGMTTEQLLEVFNDSCPSDYLVVYMRLITSGHPQKESHFYSNFIEGDRSVSEFCKQEVEPMYKESDHIHIIALTDAFKVGTRIIYMDRCEGGKVTMHDFGMPDGSDESPRVHLLYRPGHYDILYQTSCSS